MDPSNLFAGEIFTEVAKALYKVSRKSIMCKETAEQMLEDIEALFPIIREIQYSGVELPQYRQQQISQLMETMREGTELSNKIARSGRWNVYKNLQKAKKLEKIQKKISRFVQTLMLAHVWVDVHHTRVELSEGFDGMDHSVETLQRMVGEMTIGGGGFVQEAVQRREEVEVELEVGFNVGGGVGACFKVGLEVGKRKVKEMLMERDDCLVGISGIGGSGTTLAEEICGDEQVKGCFDNGILFLTVSQSPNLESLKLRINNHLRGNNAFRFVAAGRSLIVLDDVWKESDLSQLIRKETGLKFLVVSRFKFSELSIILMRVREMYTSYYEVSVTQHDVLRDLALHLNSKEEVNDCQRLLMPRREAGLPREWKRNSDQTFKALIVSAQTDEMGEMDWPSLHFLKAEALILNFTANNYYLPPFITQGFNCDKSKHMQCSPLKL